MSIFDILTLFGGLSMFLYGMRLMGDGLKEGSTGTLKSAMEKVTDNPFKAFLLGLLVTAVIQSSTGTIVLTAGLVGAGILNLHQSLGIIIGANVGTTVTGQIIRLMDVNAGGSSWLRLLQPSTLAPAALIAGIVFLMFVKAGNSKTVGTVAMGFGILFSGLMSMTGSVSVLAESGAFDSFFSSLSGNPLIGYLTGFAIAFVLQSASASIGILQAFSLSGALSFCSVWPVLLGIYMGDCLTTAMVCAIGAGREQRRVGVVNVYYNIGKTLTVILLIVLLYFTGPLRAVWERTVNSGAIADANTIFNIAGAVVLLPFVNILEKVSEKTAKEKPGKASPYEKLLSGLNPLFFSSPALAFRSAYDVLCCMYDLASENIRCAYGLLTDYDRAVYEKIQQSEDDVDHLTDRLSKYLLELSGSVSAEAHVRILDQYYKVLTEFERLSDHAVNIAEEASHMREMGVIFTEDARKDIAVLERIISHILEFTSLAFKRRSLEAARHIEPLEEVVDDLVVRLRGRHIHRLRNGRCSLDKDSSYLDLLSDTERISDICSNVGMATVARVEPEYADDVHGYTERLHRGEDEQFNREYKEEHERYFSMLEDGIC